MHIDVTIASVRNVALCRHCRMITTIAGTVEDDHVIGVAYNLENSVEADEFIDGRIVRPRQTSR